MANNALRRTGRVIGAALLAGLLGSTAGMARTEAPDARIEAPRLNEDAAIRHAIRAQVDALGSGDAGRAFEFATPEVQQIFGDPQSFLDTIRSGDDVLYAPRAMEFEDLHMGDGDAVQEATLLDADGQVYTVAYVLVQQNDGTWKIDGCILFAQEDQWA